MRHHSINGWNVFHEQKQDAPPIISVRICITRSKEHQPVALSYLYLNLLTLQIQKEAQKFTGLVSLVVEKSLRYSEVKKLMATCANAGFMKFKLSVNSF